LKAKASEERSYDNSHSGTISKRKTNTMRSHQGEKLTMSENVAQTVQKVIQDLVSPDVRELKVLVTALQKQIDQRFDAQNDKSDAQFRALMAAFGEFKAQSELTSILINGVLPRPRLFRSAR
jgi:hypothetical protein